MTDRPPVVKSETDGPVGIITLNRPDKFNCLSSAVAEGIDAAVDRFSNDGATRAILVQSEGKHFCTGADLEEVLGIREHPEKLRTFVGYGQSVMSRLEAAALPVVGAVQGLCLAGGLELALSCDVVFAGEGAQFGDQHAQYGLVPGWGGSQRLPRIIGLRRALDLLYSHRWISAAEALDWGLANYVVADDALRSDALDYCRKLGGLSRDGLAAMKQLARDGIQQTLDQGIALELDLAVAHLSGPDTQEGLAAFQEGRAPQFG